MGESSRNPSPGPSPKRGGENDDLTLAATGRGTAGEEADFLPLPASGRGPGGGVLPPPVPNIVIGQPVDDAKVERANELRREMTAAERRLWNCLRANRLAGLHFRRQQVIDGFIVDFYCHASALIVEVDGPVHEEQTE